MDLEQLREEFARRTSALHDAAGALEAAAGALEGADDESRDELTAHLSTAEEAFTAAETEAKDSREKYERAKRLADAVELTAPAAPANARVTSEPLTYERHGKHSFFQDLYRRDVRQDSGAAERLSKHMQEMEAEGKYDLSSTDSAGGYLVAPIWLQDEFVDAAVAGRTIANAIGSKSLPPNTDSINLPRLSTGTAVADQADNGAVQETDAVLDTIAADVKTIAGMQDVSQQLVDRGVPGVDGVVFADLLKRYNANLDVAVINSSTTNNKGLLQVSSTNSITYTASTPTVSGLYPKIADGIQQIHTGIFLPPDAIFMHPRRWAFMLAALDTNNRPLVTPYAPQNAVGTAGSPAAEGPVGSCQGLPVYTDPNIPITGGAGTNEDAVLIVRRDELFLWEESSGPFLETFRDVGSGTLTVRFRLHNYWAQLHARRPKAISKVTGTGLATPTF